MSETGQPITECPVCRYNPTGLPKNYRCPECGFEYDETMRIWRPGSSPIVFLRIIAAAVWLYQGFYLAIELLLVSCLLWKHVMGGQELVERVFWFSLASYSLMFPRRPRFLIVWRGGLVYQFKFASLCRRPLADVAIVTDHSAPFRVRSGCRMRRLPGFLFLSPSEKNDLHGYLRACLTQNAVRELRATDPPGTTGNASQS
jgi:hypothetical protein